MAGRYGVASPPPARRHRSKKSASSRLVRLTGLVTGIGLVSFGVVSLTTMGGTAESQDIASGGRTSLMDDDMLETFRDTDRVSRSAERGPGRQLHTLEKTPDVPLDEGDEADAGQEPGQTEEPEPDPVEEEPDEEPDPNEKPEATGSLPEDSGDGKRVVFDITQQQVWLVAEDGDIARTYLVSGSRYDQLPEGTYEVFSTSEEAISWTYEETMRYMVRFHRGENSNIGFHDIPVYDDSGEEVQTLSELGTALSDGCIRQDSEDAKALWDFAPVGTMVVVVRS